MRILLLSAYDAHSHHRWRQGLVAAFPEWQWTVLTLPPRHFLWRIRSNSLSWACAERNTLAGHLQSLCSCFERGVLPAAPCVVNLFWEQRVPAYRQAINGLA